MPQTLRALVTAGGTQEPIDDVRVITNRSRGFFGEAICKALLAAHVETTLLGSKDVVSRVAAKYPALHCESFTNFKSIDARLASYRDNPFDLVFMAAAIADYSPLPIEGKISSEQDELVIRLKKNPKLIARLRQDYGLRCFLVGFKLLSQVSEQTLIEVGRAQLAKNQLDLTVANDLARLHGSEHPIVLLTSSGETLHIEGERHNVATRLVAESLQRRAMQLDQSI
jgi:phosphopantothenoylcysteine decarboxylase/phosphopantothenate--cysteine ligase